MNRGNNCSESGKTIWEEEWCYSFCHFGKFNPAYGIIVKIEFIESDNPAVLQNIYFWNLYRHKIVLVSCHDFSTIPFHLLSLLGNAILEEFLFSVKCLFQFCIWLTPFFKISNKLWIVICGILLVCGFALIFALLPIFYTIFCPQTLPLPLLLMLLE